MSDINLVKLHTLPATKARALVQRVADDLAEKYSLASKWVGNTLRFERTGIHGAIEVLGTEIRLDITLGFLVKPFRERLRENVDKNFDRLLAEAQESTTRTATPKKPAKAAKKTSKSAAKKSGR